MEMTRGDRVFVDTNVLLEATDEGRRWHGQATALAARVENLVTGNVQDFPADAGVRILPLGELTMPGVDVG